MDSVATALLLQPCGARTKQRELQDLGWSPLLNGQRHKTRKTCRSIVPMARLFGPAIFEASKLKVLFLGDKENSGQLPRTYTLTHSDITSKLTLAISNTINAAQLGWYNKLQRDEVVAEWKKVQGKMSLHVHCHISGGHVLLDFIANLRYHIFSKELPVVLKAFVHGDVDLFMNHPELEEAMVWVYFHSNLLEFNRLECWGPLRDAVSPDNPHRQVAGGSGMAAIPKKCPKDCSCCFPTSSSIPWAHEFNEKQTNHGLLQQQQQQQL